MDNKLEPLGEPISFEPVTVEELEAWIITPEELTATWKLGAGKALNRRYRAIPRLWGD